MQISVPVYSIYNRNTEITWVTTPLIYVILENILHGKITKSHLPSLNLPFKKQKRNQLKE